VQIKLPGSGPIARGPWPRGGSDAARPRIMSSIVVGLVLAALSGCDRGEPQGAPPGRTPRSGRHHDRASRAVLTTELPGRTMPFAVSDVRPQVNGILKERLFTEGSLVEAVRRSIGSTTRSIAAAYESARAQLANAKAALTKAQLTPTATRRSEGQADQPAGLRRGARQSSNRRGDVQQREAEVESGGVNLGYTRITAPISGKIGAPI